MRFAARLNTSSLPLGKLLRLSRIEDVGESLGALVTIAPSASNLVFQLFNFLVEQALLFYMIRVPAWESQLS